MQKEDIEYLTKTGNRGLLKKLESLVERIERTSEDRSRET